MRPLRVPASGLSKGDFTLDDAASRYVARVHRLGAGASLVLFDPEARVEADATVTDSGRRVRCDVGALRQATRVPRAPITLVQGLGKGDKAEQIVRDATALGVTRLVFVESARTVVRTAAWGDAKRRRFHSIAVEAARQSGRGDVPEVVGPTTLANAALDGGSGALRICLAPDAPESFHAALARKESNDAPIVLFIGPEGGFDDAELASLSAAGCVLAHLGPLVLRTEVAAVAALGAVTALRNGGEGDG